MTSSMCMLNLTQCILRSPVNTQRRWSHLTRTVPTSARASDAAARVRILSGCLVCTRHNLLVLLLALVTWRAAAVGRATRYQNRKQQWHSCQHRKNVADKLRQPAPFRAVIIRWRQLRCAEQITNDIHWQTYCSRNYWQVPGKTPPSNGVPVVRRSLDSVLLMQYYTSIGALPWQPSVKHCWLSTHVSWAFPQISSFSWCIVKIEQIKGLLVNTAVHSRKCYWMNSVYREICIAQSDI